MKEEIIDCLSTLLAYNVIGDIQYRDRFNGFVGELDFRAYMRSKRSSNTMLDGGFLLPTINGNPALKNPIYFTVSSDSPSGYVEIYRRTAKLNCKNMYFLQISAPAGEWDRHDVLGIEKPLLSPPINVYSFSDDQFVDSSLSVFLAEFTDDHSHQLRDAVPESLKSEFADILMQFELQSIVDLYAQRYVFDGLIGLKKKMGIPSDVDLFVVSQSTGDLIVFEVKEKDLSKRNPIGFGMDALRMTYYTSFMDLTGLSVYYIVRQVEDQSTRKFLNWRCINMRDFIAHASNREIAGGTGMRSTASYNPTFICEDRYFKTL